MAAIVAMFIFGTREMALAAVAPSLDPNAVVSTIADHLDNPIALAYDRIDRSIVVISSNLKVVRIRADGKNVPIAGSRVGYHDGPAEEALFSNLTAVAVNADGEIVLADTGNRAIREIANGQVTTIAPGANFVHPVDVATATDGTVYVADKGVGIRVVSHDVVTTLPLGESIVNVTHIAIWNGAEPALFFVTPDGVGRIDLKTKVVTQAAQGGIEFGPTSVVALNSTQFVTSLARYQALYFGTADARYPWWRRVTGNAGNDATVEGSLLDGNPETARFDGPAGLTLDEHSNILVADSGNRRIRFVPALDTRWESGTSIIEPDSKIFRIGFISNSVAFRNSMWSDSIAGVIERRLNADQLRSKDGRAIQLRAAWLGNDISSVDEYFANSVVPGTFDCVVWAFDYNMFNPEHNNWPYAFPAFDRDNTARWASSISTGLRILGADGIPVMLTDVPFGFQISPVESELFRDTYAGRASSGDLLKIQKADNGTDFDNHLEQLLSSFKVPYAATYDRFVAYERGPHVPLYPADDYHLTPIGTAFMGDLITDYMEKANPCGLSAVNH